MRAYPEPQWHDVTAPNTDTLYTITWLDLSQEPWVLGLPAMKGRYYLAPLLDAWTNVFQAPGTRTTGTSQQTFAVTGPGWKGKLPAGLKEYQSPTNIVWMIGRIHSKKSGPPRGGLGRPGRMTSRGQNTFQRHRTSSRNAFRYGPWGRERMTSKAAPRTDRPAERLRARPPPDRNLRDTVVRPGEAKIRGWATIRAVELVERALLMSVTR
jgi:hypothetical protein